MRAGQCPLQKYWHYLLQQIKEKKLDATKVRFPSKIKSPKDVCSLRNPQLLLNVAAIGTSTQA